MIMSNIEHIIHIDIEPCGRWDIIDELNYKHKIPEI